MDFVPYSLCNYKYLIEFNLLYRYVGIEGIKVLQLNIYHGIL